MKKTTTILLLVLLSSVYVLAQRQNLNRDSLYNIQDSRNGYILPVSGHLHILVIFAEVIYDTDTDPCPPEGTNGWRAGQLPSWKDELFDPFPSSAPKGIVSTFFHESSFGNYIVTGDYLINPLHPEKPVQILASQKVSAALVLKNASDYTTFQTGNNFSVQDFDKWTMTHVGHPKQTPGTDSPMRYDHVMIIIRNSNYPSNLSGWTSSRSPAPLFGYESDTYSFFCTHELLPFNILLHEYSHMLFGGNNFHAGGSHSKKAGYSYFPHIQGGWGMMGAAWKSFLTTNAWERRRLGWKPEIKQWFISTLDSAGTHEINADLDATNQTHEGVYLIRDFVSTGDAIRIRIPFLPENVFQQWLWIENHQTKAFNGSEFDVFQYQNQDCMDNAVPGLYMYMQIDKEEQTGRDIFAGHADYLRPLPANGLWDFKWDNDTIQNPWCINNNFYHPHSMKRGRENPFSGSHEMELVFGDYNLNGKIEIVEYRVPAIRKEKGSFFPKLPILGAKEHAYTYTGNKLLSIGTNPSSGNLISAVSAGGEIKTGQPPNNRIAYLNGISVEILDIPSPVAGAMFVKIRFDNYTIQRDIRWCADTIIFPESNDINPRILTLENRSTLHIDRGLTPTRILNPDTVSHQLMYTKPTIFIIEKNTQLRVGRKSALRISNGSECIVEKGGKLMLDKGSKLIISEGSRLILSEGSEFTCEKGVKIRVKKGGSIIWEKTTSP
jgi:hypothetical protein